MITSPLPLIRSSSTTVTATTTTTTVRQLPSAATVCRPVDWAAAAAALLRRLILRCRGSSTTTISTLTKLLLLPAAASSRARIADVSSRTLPHLSPRCRWDRPSSRLLLLLITSSPSTDAPSPSAVATTPPGRPRPEAGSVGCSAVIGATRRIVFSGTDWKETSCRACPMCLVAARRPLTRGPAPRASTTEELLLLLPCRPSPIPSPSLPRPPLRLVAVRSCRRATAGRPRLSHLRSVCRR